MAIRLDPPRPFSFVAKDWLSWKSHFERRAASGLAKWDELEQVNTLIYVMGIKAEEVSKAFVYAKPSDAVKYDIWQSSTRTSFPEKTLFTKSTCLRKLLESFEVLAVYDVRCSKTISCDGWGSSAAERRRRQPAASRVCLSDAHQ